MASQHRRIFVDRSYIVRVYRSGRHETRGVVEDVAINSREGFSSAESLWQLVARPEEYHVQTEVVPLALASTYKKDSKTATIEALDLNHGVTLNKSHDGQEKNYDYS